MDFPYTNVIVLESQHKGRGELLPYYYFLKNKFFENAVIIHDSVFIHKRIQFESMIGKLCLSSFKGSIERGCVSESPIRDFRLSL
jgi:hypothetical protein